MDASPGQVTETGESCQPLHVLLADDEPTIVALLRRLLERRGHRVRTAATAEQAIGLVESHRFDAVLVDLRMPGGGMTVVARLRGDDSFHGRIVLMTGALATDPDVEPGPGVIRLQKPFKNRDLFPLLEGDAQH